MGSLQSVGSLGVILMPLLGTALLGAASHLPPRDWRVGGPFFVCAAMQAVAIVVAQRYFRNRSRTRSPA
jgi:DHA1 family tetracycline resistance protein-like MFS transporter